MYTSDKEEIAHYPLEYNDLLFNRTNSKELVGKTAIYKSEVPAIYAGYLIRITPLIDSDYLNYVMQTQFYWVYCQNVRSDAIGQSNINAEKLKNFIYPLPPLHEQKRIAKNSIVFSPKLNKERGHTFCIVGVYALIFYQSMILSTKVLCSVAVLRK